MTLVGFLPFKTAEDALENAMAVAEGSLSASLQAFLQSNLRDVPCTVYASTTRHLSHATHWTQEAGPGSGSGSAAGSGSVATSDVGSLRGGAVGRD